MRLGNSWPIIGLAPLVPETTGSEASLQQLDKWLNRCRQEHGICGRRTAYTPRRVLDLGPLDHPPNVRLHEPSPGEELEYLCLSYRWSAAPTLQTLKSNVEDHKLAIPWDRLPLAFQHVCAVSRRLRLRYVWIDALCIVQDDEDDKALDVAVMDSIFEGGVLTIVSAWASGPEQGLFGHLGDFSHHEFPATTENGASQTVCVRRQLPHFENDNLPCLNRGWIYQELLLSPRLALFLDSEIVWQCQEHTECQCSPYEPLVVWDPDQDRSKGRLRRLNGARSAFRNKPSLLPLDAAAYWWSHVEAYSPCQLTNPSDKLPAIQGLAARMGSVLRLGSYIAGAWEDTLLTDLAWFALFPGTGPKTWRAPTWSWASVDGAVQNHVISSDSRDWKPLAAVAANTSEPRGVAANSHRVRITLDCHVHEAWLGMDEMGKLVELTPKRYVLNFKDHHDMGGQRVDFRFRADFELGTEGVRDNALWCAKILRLQEDDNIDEVWLVLRNVRGDEYERIGCLRHWRWTGDKEAMEGWKRETIQLI